MTQTITLEPVQITDAGVVEGPADHTHPSLRLHYAITAVAKEEANSLYEKIRKKYELGYVTAEQWVANMNAAIERWNEHLPDSATAIARAYEL